MLLKKAFMVLVAWVLHREKVVVEIVVVRHDIFLSSSSVFFLWSFFGRRRVVSKAMILYISVDIIGEKKVTTSCIALSLVSNSRYSYYMFFSSSVLQFFFEL